MAYKSGKNDDDDEEKEEMAVVRKPKLRMGDRIELNKRQKD